MIGGVRRVAIRAYERGSSSLPTLSYVVVKAVMNNIFLVPVLMLQETYLFCQLFPESDMADQNSTCSP